jgi:hypothetical protein
MNGANAFACAYQLAAGTLNISCDTVDCLLGHDLQLKMLSGVVHSVYTFANLPLTLWFNVG